jgi:hypothetical protein
MLSRPQCQKHEFRFLFPEYSVRHWHRAYGRLPVMDEVKREAERRKVELVVLPTSRAIDVLNKNPEATNAILHVTC